jgi:uncharacterized integral membrane protein
MSLGGVAVSLANFVSAAYGDPWPFWSAHCAGDRRRLALEDGDGGKCGDGAYQKVDEAVFFYFFLGSATLGLCMVGFSYIVRTVRHREDDRNGAYGSIGGGGSISGGSGGGDEPVVESAQGTPRIGLELPTGGNTSISARQYDEPEQQHVVARGGPNDGENNGDDDDVLPAWPPASAPSSGETSAVWHLIWAPALSCFLVFAVTLSLFPAWTAQIQSTQQCQTTSRWRNDLFTPLSFVLFNVGDLAGRLLSSRVPLGTAPHRSRNLVRCAALRFLFYILLYICPSASSTSTARSWMVVHNDLYTILVLLLFALSNGYIVSTAFCHAPSLMASLPDRQKERMAEILNLSLSVGLLVGSFLSFPVTALMSG